MVSPSGKFDLQLNITKFNADKNDFCRKFSGVSTAKDFVGKFKSTRSTIVIIIDLYSARTRQTYSKALYIKLK